MRALVTTTINVPTVLHKYRASMDDGDVVIVVGDKSSPHHEIVALLDSLPGQNLYLHPNEQSLWRVSELIGWRCIQRRNIGFLVALELGADTVTTIDDDNIPDVCYFNDLDLMLRPMRRAVAKTASGWYNPAQHCEPSVVHRGFPYSQRHVAVEPVWRRETVNPGVVAGLWLGDPDIDAAERMVNAPDVTKISARGQLGFALAPGTWAPFNTQNTTIVRDLVPALYCWPHVGRFDDIWASYLTRAVMDRTGYHALYGRPVVRQERNPHNLVRDLEAEIFGYRYTDDVCQALRELGDEPSTDPVALTLWYFDQLKGLGFLPVKTCESFVAWCEDVREAMSG